MRTVIRVHVKLDIQQKTLSQYLKDKIDCGIFGNIRYYYCKHESKLFIKGTIPDETFIQNVYELDKIDSLKLPESLKDYTDKYDEIVEELLNIQREHESFIKEVHDIVIHGCIFLDMDIINKYDDWKKKVKEFKQLCNEIIDKCVNLVLSNHEDIILHQYIGEDSCFSVDDCANDEEILTEYFDGINKHKFYRFVDLH